MVLVGGKMMNNQDKIPITKEGLNEIKEEYQKLVEEKRPLAVERLADTRELGELTEESDYTQAKQELAFIDGRIKELEEVINKSVLINAGHRSCQEVKLGCRVTVQAGKENHVFHLVGEWEADPTEMRISYQSPLGQQLLGKKVGDQVEVKAPAGKIVYTIKSID